MEVVKTISEVKREPKSTSPLKNEASNKEVTPKTTKKVHTKKDIKTNNKENDNISNNLKIDDIKIELNNESKSTSPAKSRSASKGHKTLVSSSPATSVCESPRIEPPEVLEVPPDVDGLESEREINVEQIKKEEKKRKERKKIIEEQNDSHAGADNELVEKNQIIETSKPQKLKKIEKIVKVPKIEKVADPIPPLYEAPTGHPLISSASDDSSPRDSSHRHPQLNNNVLFNETVSHLVGELTHVDHDGEINVRELLYDGEGHKRRALVSPSTILETLSKNRTRLLRFSQKELHMIGQNKIQTKIEVLEFRSPVPVNGLDRMNSGDLNKNNNKSRNSPQQSPADQIDAQSVANIPSDIIFSVKHVHDGQWTKQLVVHKNLLVACVLTDVPCPIEIPEASLGMFQCTENIQHVHIYLERLVPHLRFHRLSPSVCVFWWRAVGDGALVFQNWETGKLIILANKGKSIPAAAATFRRGLDLMNRLPSTFSIKDPDFDRLSVSSQCPDSKIFPSAESVAAQVQEWAVEDAVSPWMTNLIIKSRGKTRSQVVHYRYSLGVEYQENDPKSIQAEGRPLIANHNQNESGNKVAVSIQVHFNEPLSRELRAYPVCQVPVLLDSFKETEIAETYLRALWFLRKLYDYHFSSEETRLMMLGLERAKRDRAAQVGASPCRADQSNFDKYYVSTSGLDITEGAGPGGVNRVQQIRVLGPTKLSDTMNLMGGVRLVEYPVTKKNIRILNSNNNTGSFVRLGSPKTPLRQGGQFSFSGKNVAGSSTRQGKSGADSADDMSSQIGRLNGSNGFMRLSSNPHISSARSSRFVSHGQ